jgi:hypothetical protein
MINVFPGGCRMPTAGVMWNKEGRIDQPSADGAAFCILIFIRDISLLNIEGMY